MSYPKYIDRYHRVDLYEWKENAQFSVIFGGVRQLEWRFSNFFDFEKSKALQDLWMVFSKTTHYRGYLGKIWRNRKFRDCRLLLGIYRNWLLNCSVWTAPFLWRISVDGRPYRRNKAAFSNFSGVVYCIHLWCVRQLELHPCKVRCISFLLICPR